MVDETYAALQYAGPASWHHLIAPTRTIPLTTHSIHAISFAMSPGSSDLDGSAATCQLGYLSVAANLTANAIANSIFVADANTIFKDARTTATILDVANEGIPQFTPTVNTYRYVKQALETNDPQVLSMLLVDIIRTANHIAES